MNGRAAKGIRRDDGQDPGVHLSSESGHSPGTARVQIADNKGELTRTRVTLSSARPPKTPPLARRLYDLKAISGHLGIPVHTVRELLWRGDLAYVRIGRRQYVDIKDVDDLIEQNKVREVR